MTRTIQRANVAPLRPIRTGDVHRHVMLVNALAAGATAGFHELSSELTTVIRRVTTLEHAADDARAETRRIEGIIGTLGNATFATNPQYVPAGRHGGSGWEAAVKQARERAAAGEDPGDVEDELATLEAMLPRVQLRAEILGRALTDAANEIGTTVHAHASWTFETLAAALAEITAVAAPDAPVVLDALAGRWERPEALEEAPASVVAAFRRLELQTSRHDYLRRTGYLAHQVFEQDGGERIRPFEGGGIVFTRSGGFDEHGDPATDRIQVVEYRPQGHPVQRLALAALAAREAVRA